MKTLSLLFLTIAVLVAETSGWWLWRRARQHRHKVTKIFSSSDCQCGPRNFTKTVTARALDRDGDGEVSLREANQVLDQLEDGPNLEDLQQALDLEERYAKTYNKTWKSSDCCVSTFHSSVIDHDHDGHVGTREAAEVLDLDEDHPALSLFMQHADQKRDGFVDIDEFREALADMGYCYCSVNIALNKPTMESGTGYGADSSRANDGGYDPDFYAGSCSFTTSGDQPYVWWIVDLGAVYRISHVVIARRSGSAPLNDLQFEMYNGVPLICNHQPALCTYVPSELTFPTHNVTCDDDTAVGRYLMIRHVSVSTDITLCEAEVYGDLVQDTVGPSTNCSGPVWLNRRSYHGLTGDEVIAGNVTSAVACAKECFATGECAAFSFNTDLTECQYSAGFVKAFVTASAGWLTYDFC